MLKMKNNVGALYCFDKLFSMLFLFIHNEGMIYESPGSLNRISFLP